MAEALNYKFNGKSLSNHIRTPASIYERFLLKSVEFLFS